MKKLALLIFFISFSVNAQYINGSPVSKLKEKYKYIEVYIQSTKTTKPEIKDYVVVYFGQTTGGKKGNKRGLIYKEPTPSEKTMQFINDASVLNFFYENGYRVHTAYRQESNNFREFLLERID